MGLRLQSPDTGRHTWGLERIVFPRAQFRLQDVLDYYRSVAPLMLAHLNDRPVTLKRYPDEVAGDVFYEKSAPAFTPAWVKRFRVPRRSGGAVIDYILIQDRRTLDWAVSVGTLEFHPFLAKVPETDQPTAVVFDLDPGRGANIVQCARVALLLRKLLSRLELQSFAKVSGSLGLQVYVPLNTPISYSATQPFAKTVAEYIADENPRLVLSEMARSERAGRVFIDWSQNAAYKSTVSVYSLRAKRTTPFISLPVTWNELEQAVEQNNGHDLYYHPDRALHRIREVGDLFQPVLKLKQHLPEAFVRGTSLKRRQRVSQRRGTDPVRSRQGSRRLFRLQRDGKAARLTLELHNLRVTFNLPSGVPLHAGHSARALMRRPEQTTAAVTAEQGTCELIEGSVGKGYLRVFLSGDRLHGECVFEEIGSEKWSITRVR